MRLSSGRVFPLRLIVAERGSLKLWGTTRKRESENETTYSEKQERGKERKQRMRLDILKKYLDPVVSEGNFGLLDFMSQSILISSDSLELGYSQKISTVSGCPSEGVLSEEQTYSRGHGDLGF